MDHLTVDSAGAEATLKHATSAAAWETFLRQHDDFDDFDDDVELQAPPTEAAEPGVVRALKAVFDLAQAAVTAENRAAAEQVFALSRAMTLARTEPRVYLRAEGMTARDALGLVDRALAVDAAAHLGISENRVRTLAWEGGVLTERLPLIGELFRDGVIAHRIASIAADEQVGVTDAAALRILDAEFAALAVKPAMTPTRFKRRAIALRSRVLDTPPEVAHERACEARRVIVEPADDGMAWIMAFVTAADAIRVRDRVNATARDVFREKAGSYSATEGRDERSQTQIRADLFVSWLAGDGTPTAARVRPMLMVPILSLIGVDDRPSVLQGYGPIDAKTAANLFANAPAFRTIGTDPSTGEPLNFGRTRYRPTSAQRAAIAMMFGSCAGLCDRAAAASEIDHNSEWVRDSGATDLNNLVPLCCNEHRLKTLTRLQYDRARDGTITLITPTGGVVVTHEPTDWSDDPPF